MRRRPPHAIRFRRLELIANEGHARRDQGLKGGDDAVGIFSEYAILDAKDHDIFRSEKLVATRIGRFNVMSSVELDGNSRLWAVEVEDERREWMLAAKLEPKLFAAHELPEHALFRRRAPPQLASVEEEWN